MIAARNVRQIVEDDSNPQDAISPRHDSFLDSIFTFINSCRHALGTLIYGHAYELVEDEDDEKDPHRKLTDLWRTQNVAIPLSYFVVGFALTFISTPITYYAVDTLDADSALVNTLSCVQQIPWGFKLVYGILSDCQPIMRQRRKPYFVIGWSVYVLSNLVLAFIGTPSMACLIALVFVQTAGYMLSDVMADALVVERSKLEPGLSVGTMQATSYILRYFGNIIGSVFGTILYNKEEWGWGLTIAQVFFLNAVVPVLFVLPFVWHLSDPFAVDEIRTLSVQFEDIWSTVQKRSIWQPMIFIYMYTVTMVPNAAWNNFLIDGLGFTDWMIGVVSIAGAIFAWLGVIFYRYYLFNDSWRVVYIWTTVVLLFFSCMQLILIFQINEKMHISDLWFALGDNSAADFVMAVQFLPMVKMYLQLCPDGAEGTTYAMLTTYANVAGSVSYNIGTLLAYVWDVSNEALSEGDWTGMWKLTLLTSCLNPIALVFIGCIPESPEHQKKLQASEERSRWGGFIFLVVLVVSLVWSVAQTVVVSYTGGGREGGRVAPTAAGSDETCVLVGQGRTAEEKTCGRCHASTD